MKIAVEGCAHGELELIYETIQGIEKAEQIKVDLLLCCGDFQSTRNLPDLETMAVPKKYQDICTFYKYYSGELVAPMLTIFIGGNHEASNYLQELPYGGWVAPNIYYLGYAGVVKVNGIRIGGVSGIYKGHDFLKGHFEFPPYTEATKKSVYHVRTLEVFRLKQLSGKIDIFMSHDWPRGIYNYGNKAQLIRFKPHFRDEIENEQLGSRPCEELLKVLQPSLWFAAHLHCKFAAVVSHASEIDKDCTSTETSDGFTKFLALDKCLPKRRFLQLIDFDSNDDTDDGQLRFEYDLEWLTILFLTNHLVNVKNCNSYMPGARNSNSGERYCFTPSEEELQHVKQRFDGDLRIPRNFCRTVEPYDPATDSDRISCQQPKAQINPQCVQFCDALVIDDPLSLAMLIGGHELNHSSNLDTSCELAHNDSSGILFLGEQSDADNSSTSQQQLSPLKRKSNLSLPKPIGSPSLNATNESCNPDEIDIDKDVEDNNDFKTDGANNTNLPHEISSSKPSPPIKKFKRRNQNIYQEIDDNEDQLT